MRGHFLAHQVTSACGVRSLGRRAHTLMFHKPHYSLVCHSLPLFLSAWLL